MPSPLSLLQTENSNVLLVQAGHVQLPENLRIIIF